METKIVVDTNVYIGALIGREEAANRELLRQCLRGNYRPLMSNALFTEYQEVMSRDEIKSKCPLTVEAEFDAETKFKAMVAQGNSDRGIAILDKLDAYFSAPE